MSTVGVAIRRISFDEGVGGMERAAAQHIQWLVEGGADVTLFAPREWVFGSLPTGVSLAEVPWPPLGRSHRSPLFGFSYQHWTKTLAARLDESASSLDCVHFHGGAAGALWNMKNASIRTSANPHGMEAFGKFSLLRAPNRVFLKRVLRGAQRSDVVIATDRSLVDAVARNTQVARDRILVIPNAVNVGLLDSLAHKSAAADHDDSIRVVTIGRIVRNKGYDLLAAAIRLLPPQTRGRIRWTHFGDGPLRDQLIESATASGLRGFTLRSGESDAAVQTGLANADLFVQPSRHEGSSLTTLEAMAHGRIVVATPVGGIPDKVTTGVTGYLSDAVTASSIAATIQLALSSSGEVGSNARARVIRDFSGESIRARYYALHQIETGTET